MLRAPYVTPSMTVMSPSWTYMVVTGQYLIPTSQLTKQGKEGKRAFSACASFLRNEAFPRVPQQMRIYILSA